MHTMIDLETLGTGPNALIISIGAVKFDPNASEVGEKFHVGIDLHSFPAKAYGFDIDPGTVGWWLDPERSAGRVALEETPKTDILSALDGFSLWLNKDMPIWGNGAAFDNVILRNAYDRVGLVAPWGFYDDRCYRTFKNIAPDAPRAVRFGAHHSALDDAVTQAVHLQEIVKFLKLPAVS
jgi:exodeoxyribonuclease VIII